MVLKYNDSVWGTGRNYVGELGDGSATDKRGFVQVISSGVKAVAAGRDHSMVLKHDGSLWGTGQNDYGQLGDGLTNPKSSSVQVISSGAKAVIAGYCHVVELGDG